MLTDNPPADQLEFAGNVTGRCLLPILTSPGTRRATRQGGTALALA